MLRAILRYLVSWIPFLGRNFTPSTAKNINLEDDLPPARVAIIGAGISGCFSAKFLRELGGRELDIHIWNKKDSTIGGRAAIVKVGEHWHESGASIAHSSNKYLVDAAKDYGLKTKKDNGDSVPFGIYNGTTFVLRTGTSKIITLLKMLWRYGVTLFRMDSGTRSLLKKFKRIYTLQENGESYASVGDMLRAMDQDGESVHNLIKVSAKDYFTELGWSENVIDELVTAAMRVNYGQGTEVNAFCTYVSLAGMEDGSLWCVVGGNWQIAEKVLKASGATLHEDDVTTVTRLVKDQQLKYKITTISGEDYGYFDVVIVANPLNTSAINYLEFPTPVYSAASTTPYQRTVAEFVNGRINREFFGGQQNDKSFPLTILTTEMTGAPFDFRSVAINVPTDVPQEEMQEYYKTYTEEPVRCWKIFTPRPLTEDEKKQMFSDIKDVATVDWLAYPHYHTPEQCPPFILDDGMFYVNAIEKAASAMEMGAIGAKNAALLAREYLLKKSSE